MHNRVYLTLFLAFIGTLSAVSQTNFKIRKNYIKKYRDLAIDEMNQFDIPASITMAQAVLESNAGQSRLAQQGNNHFGIKCHNEWDGKRIHKTDDRFAECFRKYDDPAFSFRDHSLFLSQKSRYAFLFDYDITDYKKWAKGLQKAEYATNPKYAGMLIRIVKKYNLHELDKHYKKQPVAYREPLERAPAPSKDNLSEVSEMNEYTVYENNGKRLVIAGKDESCLKLAHALDIQKKTMKRYNDLVYDRGLAEGEFVYLEGKRWRSRNHTFHIVRKNESWHSIAQRYGVRVAWLHVYNFTKNTMNPGDRVRLKLF